MMIVFVVNRSKSLHSFVVLLKGLGTKFFESCYFIVCHFTLAAPYARPHTAAAQSNMAGSERMAVRFGLEVAVNEIERTKAGVVVRNKCILRRSFSKQQKYS